MSPMLAKYAWMHMLTVTLILTQPSEVDLPAKFSAMLIFYFSDTLKTNWLISCKERAEANIRMSDDDDFMCDDEEYDLVSQNNTEFYCHLNDTGTSWSMKKMGRSQ